MHLHHLRAPIGHVDMLSTIAARAPDDPNAAKLVNETIPVELFTHGLTGVDQAANWLFANALLVSFMVLLAGTMVYRWLGMANSHMRRLMTLGVERDQRYWMYNHTSFWPRIKKDLFYAPLFRARHNTEMRLSQAISFGTLPSRFHTVLLLLYVGSNIAYCLVLDWSKLDSAAVIAELRGRTGILSALNLVPTIVFALRNNPIMVWLHISYDTFNLLHRWCARIMVLEALLHTLCWLANELKAGGQHQLASSLAHSTSFQAGMVATCVLVFVALSSSGPIRHAFYETFLNVHRLLVLAGIIGIYIHLDVDQLPLLPLVKLSLVLWGLELVFRMTRIVFHNLSRRRGFTRVTVEALPSEACRVTFELARPWHWVPGCHVHAYLPTLALWSSHPFSVAWVENGSRGAPMEFELEKMAPSTSSTTALKALGKDLDLLKPSHARNGSAVYSRASVAVTEKLPATTSSLPRAADSTHLTLVMRARTGMTRSLYRRAERARAQGRIYTTWGAIEGPYGGHESLLSYGTVLLFAGGIGITHCVGYLHHLITAYQQGTASTRKILLVWSVPNTEALEWVRAWMDRILRMEGRRDVLRIQLFVTKPRHRGEVVSNTGSVQMFPGRCNPKTIVEKEMAERIGAMGVTVCGPGAFADSVRSACRGVMDVGAVDFVEEAFTY